MCSELISLTKDIIISGAAITGAYVAIKGLGTWQRQLKGQADYELSRRLLVSLYKYRDAINGVRHPVMWANEIPAPPDNEAKTMTHEQIRYYGTSKAYQMRWDKVQTERTNLYADLLEAEALWGNELNSLFQTVFTLEHELFTDIRQYLELINPDTHDSKKEALTRIREKKREVMYDELDDETDEFKKEFKDAVRNIEEYLKPKLIR